MNRKKTRGLRFLVILALLFSLSVSAFAAKSDRTLEAAVNSSASFMFSAVKTPQVGSIGGEWAVLGLARSGYSVPREYWDNYYIAVEEYVKSCKGVLHTKKYTEYSRVTVALTAIGANPADVAGYNLLTPLGDFDKTIWQGINGPIWALIALDSGSYEMPVNKDAKTQATRQMYIDEIISRQLKDGGWSLTGKGGDTSPSDPDITGMALQALAKYQAQPAVKSATDKALTYLSVSQDMSGGYASWGTSNSESVVQVLTALCELGIDIDDSRFVKNGNNLLDNLLTYRKADGSFLHTYAGSGSNQMASEQGFYGLVATLRATEGKSSLYRMDDVKISVSGGIRAVNGLANKHADVKKTLISVPGITFADISAHKNQPAIEALAARAIINGRGDDQFGPDATMTRAEFATIIIKALGLTPKLRDSFGDVKSGDWFASYVGTASSYGIVNGKGEGLFDPEGTITRQEAAAMVARAAKLCGMDTALESYEVLNLLAQFSDYVTVDTWANECVAFCYSEGILDQNDLNVEPGRAILRCEIAQMLYNMLGSAKLL
jgi:hypothetical protein